MSLFKSQKPSIIQWLHKNLFNNWYNSLLTVVCLWLLFFGTKGILTWVLTQAKWQVVTANLSLFLLVVFPQELYWRLWLALFIILALAGV
ncbi:MAG: amino acid ABC transporter permease, partial [Scytonema sp. CRU_2_7]|nr:amino acid ABC transporter permease [Scytonema sp. CRU_2_7]